MFSIISAIGKNNEIGKNNDLIWKISEDLKNFKNITTGKTIVMGRKTYDSIGRPLPNRINIVISKSVRDIEGVLIYSDINKFIEDYKNKDEEIFIIGGAEIYKYMLDYTDKLYISHVKMEDKEADTFFPDINYEDWEIIESIDYENWEYKVYKRL